MINLYFSKCIEFIVKMTTGNQNLSLFILQILDKSKYSFENGLISFDSSLDIDLIEMIYIDIVIPNPLADNDDKDDDKKVD